MQNFLKFKFIEILLELFPEFCQISQPDQYCEKNHLFKEQLVECPRMYAQSTIGNSIGIDSYTEITLKTLNIN